MADVRCKGLAPPCPSFNIVSKQQFGLNISGKVWVRMTVYSKYPSQHKVDSNIYLIVTDTPEIIARTLYMGKYICKAKPQISKVISNV